MGDDNPRKETVRRLEAEWMQDFDERKFGELTCMSGGGRMWEG